MQIKISVVVPTYRRPDLLSSCLNALCEQVFDKSEYEVIIVSDGYEKEAEDVVNNFRHRFNNLDYVPLPEKRGPAAARNHGWRNSSGLLVAFTDDDCLPDTLWLKGFWDKYNGEDAVAYTGIIKVPLRDSPTDFEKNTSGLEKASFVTANCCCSRIALEKTGGFDELFSMAWREDTDLEFKLIRFGIPLYYKVNALVIHPPRKAPWGVSIKEQKKNMFNALLYKKYPDLYRKRIQKFPRWDYYVIIASSIAFFLSLTASNFMFMTLTLGCWFFLTIRFIYERLSTTSKQPDHVLEMIVTSVAIPFASVYWRVYGALKFRVLFI